MNRYPLIVICLLLAIVSVACNLSASAGASIDLTQSAQDLIPTATAQPDNSSTESTASDPTDLPSSSDDTEQVGSSADLPDASLPVISPSEPPPVGKCVVRPSQAGTLINMRTGAGLEHQSLAQLQTYAPVIDTVGEWYSVQVDNNVLFVSSTVTTLDGNCDSSSSIVTSTTNNSANVTANLQLRINNLQVTSDNFYMLESGQNIVVEWYNPPTFTQSVEFFANCNDINASGMACTDKAMDSDGTDGFTGNLVVSSQFDGATITAIAYGSQQGQSVSSEPVTIKIQEATGECSLNPLSFPGDTQVRMIPSSVSVFAEPGEPQVIGYIEMNVIANIIGNPICGNGSWFQKVRYVNDEGTQDAWILVYSKDGEQNYTSQLNNFSGNYTD